MGRKPNQLILEFFERGPKLEDASNRYQHTCKSCGEKFPKGRLDSLTNHLVKKCPTLPLRDRQRAILQFHDLPDLSDNNGAEAAAHHGQTMNLPFAPKQSMSALETLAEVSRQQLGLTGKAGGPRGGKKAVSRNNNNNNVQHGNILDEFIVQDDPRPDMNFGGTTDRNGRYQSQHYDNMRAFSPIQSEGSLTDFGAHFEALRQHVPGLPPMFQYGGGLPPSSDNSNLSGLGISQSLAPSSSIVPPTLMMTASAAQELMPNSNMAVDSDIGNSGTALTDNFLRHQGRQSWPNSHASNIDPSLQDSESNLPTTVPEAPAPRVSSYPRLIAMNPNSAQTHFTTDFSINQKSGKPKVRGRFSDSRRKEVQEVRKRGACIRCRMLKKPCSGETPCSTCVSVESARLWKAPCIRTRIAEEFNLYSAGLHSVLEFHALGQAKKNFELEKVPGRVEAKHLPELSTYVTFSPLRGSKGSLPTLDPLLFGNGSGGNIGTGGLQVLDSEADDISGKLEQYIKDLAPTSHETENSSFMKITLSTLSSLSVGSKDDLLLKSLELWVATSILADRSIQWQLSNNPSAPPSASLVTLSNAEIEADATASVTRQPIPPTAHRESYDLIVLQILGATEKRAGTLAKLIMNDIERRLLQRQQAKPFETYLVSIVLLACVERMCWYFKTWEAGNNAQDGSTTSGMACDDSQLTSQVALLASEDLGAFPIRPSPAKWPLDRQPPHYSQQGERFSDILVMLLRMRGVPPKIEIRAEDGVLIAAGDDADSTTREWFERVAVTNIWCNERPAARYAGKNPNEWEGKYFSKVVGAGLS